MKRNDWQFSFSVRQIAAACERKLKHHTERLDWWRREVEQAEIDLKSQGVEFREYPVTGGNRMEAILDPQRAARLAECKGKVVEHEYIVKQVRAYLVGLRQHDHGERLFLCDAEDILWLGLDEDATADEAVPA